MAGLRTCEALRQQGYTEPIVLIGSERHAPYTRPPLSKEVLRSDVDVSKATLRTADEIAALGHRPAARPAVRSASISMADGYNRRWLGAAARTAVIATGATPRRLPGEAFESAHVLRGIDDCLDLRRPARRRGEVEHRRCRLHRVSKSPRPAHELAVCRYCHDVLPAPLARVLPVRGRHKSYGGCTKRTASRSSSTPPSTAHAAIDADVVVVGIGRDRIRVGWRGPDSTSTTASCATPRSVPRLGYGRSVTSRAGRVPTARPMRVEHWTNATEQPHHVAKDVVDGTRRTRSCRCPTSGPTSTTPSCRASGKPGPDD